MAPAHMLTSKERRKIEELIKAFDNHGCGLGLDVKARAAMRQLLDVLDEANGIIQEHRYLPAT